MTDHWIDEFSDNLDVVSYVLEMKWWILGNVNATEEKVDEQILKDKNRILSLFNPDPETIFHQDPAKFAEMLAVIWGWIDEPEIEFI